MENNNFPGPFLKARMVPADVNGSECFTLFSQLSYQFPKLHEGGAQEFRYEGTQAFVVVV